MGRLNTVKIPVFKLFFIFDAILMKIPMFFLGVGEGLRGSSGEWCWSAFIISGSLFYL